jgi:hypothetical protein
VRLPLQVKHSVHRRHQSKSNLGSSFKLRILQLPPAMAGINPGDEKLVFESSEAVQVRSIFIELIRALIRICTGRVDV